jgi:hypothetical protein
MASANNNLDILDYSPLFSDMVNIHLLPVRYSLNGREYIRGYILADRE